MYGNQRIVQNTFRVCLHSHRAIQIPIWAWVPFDSSEPCALGSRAIGGSGAGRRVQVMAKMDTDADGSITVRDRPGRLSVALGDFRSQSVVYGAFAWAHRAYVVYSCCNITSGTLCTVVYSCAQLMQCCQWPLL